MANRKYTSGSDVPELTGKTDRDVQEMHDYLYLLANELGYRLGRIEQILAGLTGEEL